MMRDHEQARLELVALRRLEVTSLAEATTLVLLVGIAVPLKHLFGQPLAVAVMGPIHGMVFITYLWMLAQTATGDAWRPSERLRLLLMSCIPFAGYSNLPLIRRKAKALDIGL